MGVHLGRNIFVQDTVTFSEETFCLDDGREIIFYQIKYEGKIYQISHEVGFCLEQALTEISRQNEESDSIQESALIGYTMKLKKENFH